MFWRILVENNTYRLRYRGIRKCVRFEGEIINIQVVSWKRNPGVDILIDQNIYSQVATLDKKKNAFIKIIILNVNVFGDKNLKKSLRNLKKKNLWSGKHVRSTLSRVRLIYQFYIGWRQFSNKNKIEKILWTFCTMFCMNICKCEYNVCIKMLINIYFKINDFFLNFIFKLVVSIIFSHVL